MSEFAEKFLTTRDGRTLYIRDYPNSSERTPVICIPGVQSTLRCFDFIAAHMAKRRRVLCLDLRGRGRSDYDSDPKNYSLKTEAEDVLELVKRSGLKKAVLLGSSRGGLAALALASRTPLVAGLILNDMGAQMEADAMYRTLDDIVPPTSFPSWDAAANAVKSRHGAWFPDLPKAKWLDWAKTIYREEDGRVVPDSDPVYEATLRTATQKLPPGGALKTWTEFERMAPVPILVVRGEHSDLLTTATVERMTAMKPGLVTVIVKGCGHRPFLDEPESVAAIDAFLADIV